MPMTHTSRDLPSVRRAGRAFSVFAAAFAVLALAVPLLAAGCENKMEAKDCDKFRGDAFDLLNKAQHCNIDADCQQSGWPGCAKPVSGATVDAIKPMKDAFDKGKCVEPTSQCKEPPPSYCKQGLCAHRERGTSEGSGNTPTDQIKIQ